MQKLQRMNSKHKRWAIEDNSVYNQYQINKNGSTAKDWYIINGKSKYGKGCGKGNRVYN